MTNTIKSILYLVDDTLFNADFVLPDVADTIKFFDSVHIVYLFL